MKSAMMSNLFQMLLWVLVGFGALELLGMIVYAIDLEFFSDYLYTGYGIIEIMTIVLYYIVIVLYLVWIYRVHMDLRQFFPDFPRSPGGAIAATLIPFYSIYGVPSTYFKIGDHFLQARSILFKEARWVRGLALPLILAITAANILQRVIRGIDTEVSAQLLVAESIVTCAMYVIFLLLCRFVSQGLNKLFEARNAPMTFELENQIAAEYPDDHEAAPTASSQ